MTGPRDCPCTMIEQDETCPVGFPSLLCEACDGRGILPPAGQAFMVNAGRAYMLELIGQRTRFAGKSGAEIISTLILEEFER